MITSGPTSSTGGLFGITTQDLLDAAKSIYGFATSPTGISLGTGAAGGVLTKAAYDRLTNVGKEAKTQAEQLAKELLPMTQFRPFTVTSATGGQFGVGPSDFVFSETDDTLTLRGPSGNIPVSKSDPRLAGLSNQEIYETVFGTAPALQADITLSPQEQALQQTLLRQAQSRLGSGTVGAPSAASAGLALMGRGRTQLEQTPFGLLNQQLTSQRASDLGGMFMGQLAAPTAAREADVYERIRATQMPEEERRRLALEERLAQQGRLGVRTAMFGGTPEQLAMEQAQQEAQNRAALAAIQQAQAEQAQQGALGAQFAGLGGQLAAQEQALRDAQQRRAIQSLVSGQGMLAGGLGLQQAQQQLGLSALGGAYVPQAQLLNVQQAAQLYPQLQQQAQLFGTGTYGETMMSALEAQLIAEQKAADLMGAAGTGLLGSALS